MEMDRCRDLRDLYPAYSADATSKADAMRIQLHLGDGCAACAVEIEQLMEAFHAVPLGTRPVETSAQSREALMGEIGRTAQEAHDVPVLFPETDRNRLWKVLTVCAAISLACTAWWGNQQLQRIEQLKGEVGRAGMSQSVDTRSLERQIGELRATLQSAVNPRSKVLTITGDGVHARLFLDDDGDVATIASEPIGAPPDGSLHHLWLIDGESASLLGRLPTAFSEQGGQLRFRMPDEVSRGVGVRVTLDPAGPMPTEPGETVLN